MAEETQNTLDISSLDTDKISRVTEEMLESFANPDRKKSEKQEENSDDNLLDDAPSEDTELEEKTVVEFSEDETEVKEKPKRQHKPFFVFRLCVSIFLLLIVAAACFGIWNRWFRYDDKAQIISNWQISGTNSVVVIDDQKINLGPNAIMKYTIDDGAKIINYTIGDKSGVSHYRFSWDRNQLALVENCSTDAISTMLSDLCWFWDYMTCMMGKIDLSPAYTKNNKNEVDTENTGLEDIISNGSTCSILLDRISTKKTDTTQ